MPIYLRNFSSIPLINNDISETNFTGYDWGHMPEMTTLSYSSKPDNIVAIIVNVIERGTVIERHWNDKRGPSPADEYFNKTGNR